MSAVFAIFIVELVAHRAGASYLKKRGLSGVDHHKQGGADITHSSHGLHVSDPSAERLADTETGLGKTAESSEQEHEHEHGAEMIDETAMAQILGVAVRLTNSTLFATRLTSFFDEQILEFGVIFHSFIIGLTLAVNDDFVTLFVVLIFHRKRILFSTQLVPTDDLSPTQKCSRVLDWVLVFRPFLSLRDSTGVRRSSASKRHSSNHLLQFPLSAPSCTPASPLWESPLVSEFARRSSFPPCRTPLG